MLHHCLVPCHVWSKPVNSPFHLTGAFRFTSGQPLLWLHIAWLTAVALDESRQKCGIVWQWGFWKMLNDNMECNFLSSIQSCQPHHSVLAMAVCVCYVSGVCSVLFLCFWLSVLMQSIAWKEWVSVSGLASHSTHNRSFRQRVFPGNRLYWYRWPNNSKD